MAADFRPVAPVDPTNLRPMLFLDAARQMMLSPDWSQDRRHVIPLRSPAQYTSTTYNPSRPTPQCASDYRTLA
jgi:hypothetical protein